MVKQPQHAFNPHKWQMSSLFQISFFKSIWCLFFFHAPDVFWSIECREILASVVWVQHCRIYVWAENQSIFKENKENTNLSSGRKMFVLSLQWVGCDEADHLIACIMERHRYPSAMTPTNRHRHEQSSHIPCSSHWAWLLKTLLLVSVLSDVLKYFFVFQDLFKVRFIVSLL